MKIEQNVKCEYREKHPKKKNTRSRGAIAAKKEDQDKLLKQDSHFTTYGTKNEKGSGLGLMLCKDFVELHGGKLWFESEGEGKGTTFLFSMKALNQEA